MTSPYVCPSCRDTETLHGRDVDGEIHISCDRCGHTWQRGELRCRNCGGSGLTQRPQVMSRQPRGNQLSIIGKRVILLCPDCDREVLTASLRKNAPVPEGYVSAATLGDTDTVVRPVPTTPAKPEHAAVAEPPSTTRAPQPRAPRRPPLDAGRAPEPARPTQPPTTREAVRDFLAQSTGTTDSTAILMLASHLGAATRLSTLDRTEAPDELRAWFAGVWGQSPPTRRAESWDTVIAVLDHWHRSGWLNQDVAARLRDQGA